MPRHLRVGGAEPDHLVRAGERPRRLAPPQRGGVALQPAQRARGVRAHHPARAQRDQRHQASPGHAQRQLAPHGREHGRARLRRAHRPAQLGHRHRGGEPRGAAALGAHRAGRLGARQRRADQVLRPGDQPLVPGERHGRGARHQPPGAIHDRDAALALAVGQHARRQPLGVHRGQERAREPPRAVAHRGRDRHHRRAVGRVAHQVPDRHRVAGEQAPQLGPVGERHLVEPRVAGRHHLAVRRHPGQVADHAGVPHSHREQPGRVLAEDAAALERVPEHRAGAGHPVDLGAQRGRGGPRDLEVRELLALGPRAERADRDERAERDERERGEPHQQEQAGTDGAEHAGADSSGGANGGRRRCIPPSHGHPGTGTASARPAGRRSICARGHARGVVHREGPGRTQGWRGPTRGHRRPAAPGRGAR
ncbi:hypothetical protein PSR1_04261 [Anaeromyxobacter sp. PSR-1]|nr:hypothetical protein PSR1_04261 [Anaeromyxobacter sp. PSR-1]